MPNAGVLGVPKGEGEAPNAGVELAPKAGVELAPKSDVLLAGAPKAGVLGAPKAGVLDAPNAGVLDAPKGLGFEAACWPKLKPLEVCPNGAGVCPNAIMQAPAPLPAVYAH